MYRSLIKHESHFKRDLKWKHFWDGCINLLFYTLWQVNLFYHMQSKFQNKLVLPKRLVKSILQLPWTYFSSSSIIQTFTKFDKDSLQISLNCWDPKLTSWSWTLLEKPPNVQLLKNFPVFYGTRRFITALTRALHWSLSWWGPTVLKFYIVSKSVSWNYTALQPHSSTKDYFFFVRLSNEAREEKILSTYNMWHKDSWQMFWKCDTVQIFGNNYNKSKPDSGGN
jgi:hypothetical protein